MVYLSGEKRYVAFRERVTEREACGWLLWVEILVVHYEEAYISPNKKSILYIHAIMISLSLSFSLSLFYIFFFPPSTTSKTGNRVVFVSKPGRTGEGRKGERGNVDEDRYSVLPWEERTISENVTRRAH